MQRLNINIKHTLLLVLFTTTLSFIKAQESTNLEELLLQKGLITQQELDALKKEKPLQQNDSTATKKLFVIDLEFRPRAEYRDGYATLPNDTTKPAFFVNQRSRINLTYKREKFIFHTSIQDVRVYGKEGQFSTSGTLDVFEAYVEPTLFKNLSLRIGRQKLEIDNARLFASANWSQQSRAHEGLRLIYETSKLTTDLTGAFSQGKENIFETNFSPTQFNNYKILGVHHLKYNVNKNFVVTTLNTVDGFESKKNADVLFLRATSGGRLTFEQGNFYATLSGYYQYGTNPDGKEINAFYYQPELKLKLNKLTARLGAEITSGDDALTPSSTSTSFVPLYGVAHRFMGNMDYFTSFPNDVKNGGLINPYLFLIYQVNKKLSLRADGHLFYSENNVLDVNNNKINAFLGFENDLSFRYKFNDYTTFDFGFSYLLAEKSMETIKTGNSNTTPIWSYMMITFKPELFRSK